METAAAHIAMLGIGTAVPPNRMDQGETAMRIAEALKQHPDSMRWAKRIFKQCGVESRYTCLPELLEFAANCRYAPCTPVEDVPTTAERMAVFKREAPPLGLEAARKALKDGGQVPSDITHLITTSCTGQFLPGLDAAFINELGLSREVVRIPFYFLGCAAGLKAIGMARGIVQADPSAKVLIVCVELCTLHLQASSDREQLYAASFFGDGASACVVGKASLQAGGIFQLGDVRSVLLPHYADEMIWEVGNYGFDLLLSPNIPKRIAELVPPQWHRWFEGEPLPQLWAIHPGGRGIIDVLQDSFHLTDEQSAPSRAVLRQYGNLSSATILFVFEEMRRQLAERQASAGDGVSLAFGPGLTTELVRFRYVPATVPVPRRAAEGEELYVV